MTDDAREAVGDYEFGFHDPEHSTIRFDKGLSEQVVREISDLKDEPEWMRERRLKALQILEHQRSRSSQLVVETPEKTE